MVCNRRNEPSSTNVLYMRRARALLARGMVVLVFVGVQRSSTSARSFKNPVASSLNTLFTFATLLPYEKLKNTSSVNGPQETLLPNPPNSFGSVEPSSVRSLPSMTPSPLTSVILYSPGAQSGFRSPFGVGVRVHTSPCCHRPLAFY